MKTSQLKNLHETIRRVVVKEFTTDKDGNPNWDPGDSYEHVLKKHGFEHAPEYDDMGIVWAKDGDNHLVDIYGGRWHHRDEVKSRHFHGENAEQLDKHLTDYNK